MPSPQKFEMAQYFVWNENWWIIANFSWNYSHRLVSNIWDGEIWWLERTLMNDEPSRIIFPNRSRPLVSNIWDKIKCELKQNSWIIAKTKRPILSNQHFKSPYCFPHLFVIFAIIEARRKDLCVSWKTWTTHGEICLSMKPPDGVEFTKKYWRWFVFNDAKR